MNNSTVRHLPESLKQRVAFLLEYNGAAFCGSQWQPQVATVQGELMKALETLNIPFASMVLAGRTDKGVHAYGQVAQCDIPIGILEGITNPMAALNEVLSESLRVKAITPLGENGFTFNAIRSAEAKWYRYIIYNAPQRSALTPQNALWVRHPLDVDKMNQAAQYLIGEHCFTNFKCEQNRPKGLEQEDVCAIMRASVHQKPVFNGDSNAKFVVFDIVGSRFLYKMVRCLMGELMTIGQTAGARTSGKVLPESILDRLDPQFGRSGSTSNLNPVKPNGLTLMAIHYPEPFLLFQEDSHIQTLSHWIIQSPQNQIPRTFTTLPTHQHIGV